MGADVHDPTLRRLVQSWQKEGGQQEVAQVVDLQVHLVAVLGHLERVEHDSSLIYEPVNDRVLFPCKRVVETNSNLSHISLEGRKGVVTGEKSLIVWLTDVCDELSNRSEGAEIQKVQLKLRVGKLLPEVLHQRLRPFVHRSTGENHICAACR